MQTNLNSLADDRFDLRKPIPITIDGNYSDGFVASFDAADQHGLGCCMQEAVDALRERIAHTFDRYDRMEVTFLSSEQSKRFALLKEYVARCESVATNPTP